MQYLKRLLAKWLDYGQAKISASQVEVIYEAKLSFNTRFQVHYYDSMNQPTFYEREGNYCSVKDKIPKSRFVTYLRVFVFREDEAKQGEITICIRIRNKLKAIKTFHIDDQGNGSGWYTIKVERFKLNSN